MVDVTNARVLAVLTRAPSSGGKSRLFAALGRQADPALLEALLLDTLESAAVPGVRRVVAVTPASACEEIRSLMGRLKPAPTNHSPAPANGRMDDVQVLPQVEGDLGARMRTTMADLFEAGARAVTLIGSDLPHITAAPVAAAFEWLEQDPAALVLGPAADGGYYLLAATHVPDVFDGIEWGSARVLEQTERAAAAGGLHVHLLHVLADVDTADDLRRVSVGGAAPRVTAWLKAPRRTRSSASARVRDGLR